MKTTEAESAITFECPYCGHWQFVVYTLEYDWIDGAACESDVIDCEKCDEKVKVIKMN